MESTWSFAYTAAGWLTVETCADSYFGILVYRAPTITTIMYIKEAKLQSIHCVNRPMPMKREIWDIIGKSWYLGTKYGVPGTLAGLGRRCLMGRNGAGYRMLDRWKPPKPPKPPFLPAILCLFPFPPFKPLTMWCYTDVGVWPKLGSAYLDPVDLVDLIISIRVYLS